MTEKDLGPQPEPEIEPGEPNPGGADAIDATDPEHEPHDLDPQLNPAVEDALPDEITETEDTSTQATEDEDGDSETEPHEESPA